MAADVEMQDAGEPEDEGVSTGLDSMTEEQLNEKYPNRPRNHSKTLPFHVLFQDLFNPLNENRKKPTGPPISRKKKGPHGPAAPTPNEVRRNIIERFFSRWRQQVGNDIYPALRLIIPEKDRDRAMYGLKEKTIGKLLVLAMKIDKNSDDGYNLLNWKLPGKRAISAMAGDFAGRCYEVLSKRPLRTEVGNMTIAEVNQQLDRLSVAQKEENQLPIFEKFYQCMNPDELMWFIRIILRQMKVGATEKTFFDIWHADAENLFNVSSSLRRVCWELYDPAVSLGNEDRGVHIMQCFQPQLAAFQMHSIEKMVARVRSVEEDEFWIEEKLDGERMQLHMIEDNVTPGGMRFNFWSRKAKDYTYLYGNGFEDKNGALTRHIKDAFDDGVKNIILDGEMITWDPQEDAMVPFGTLKTAALNEQRNEFSTAERPLYRVFDCLYLNDRVLTNYTLRDRRKALEASVRSIHRRLEVHSYTRAHVVADVETLLRRVVAEASEGLVLKNPRSIYRLNDRNDDWMKVKPEYMTEFGEDLDCVVVGGYYGSGHRGGRLSTFLCGLRVDQNQVRHGANPMKTYSFCKVGGGFTAQDYANIRHHTDGKWHDWDPKRPPTEYVELAGADRQYERPDVWIRPDESVVISVKAASVSGTDQFRTNMTLRFPRFKKLRADKDWKSALSVNEFLQLKNNAEKEQKERQFEVDQSRRRAPRKTRKKTMTVVGNAEQLQKPYAGPETKVFEGLSIFVMTESLHPRRKSKAELEQLVKANGGRIVQTQTGTKDVVCIADRKTVSVASIIKRGDHAIVRPSWLFDCIEQSEADTGRPIFLLPFEPDHLFFASVKDEGLCEKNVDQFSDSYARDVTVGGLKKILEKMAALDEVPQRRAILDKLEQCGIEMQDFPGWMFFGLVICFDVEPFDNPFMNIGDNMNSYINSEHNTFRRRIALAGGQVTNDIHDSRVTHIIINEGTPRLGDIRRTVQDYSPLPRIVTTEWLEESWRAKTRLDEERFAPIYRHRLKYS
ncbi:MAG: DNA ligase (ATP) [Bathelium mastoideum]|nr:MAG: DNA ligase (ATP) [Bathelium mastoideum]